MTIAEAMRIGSRLRPQGFYDFWPDNGHSSCGLGAVYDALGLYDYITIQHKDGWEALKLFWPYADKLNEATCPRCGRIYPRLIIHLNDDHRLTREAIADFIEPMEYALGAEQPQEQSVTCELQSEYVVV